MYTITLVSCIIEDLKTKQVLIIDLIQSWWCQKYETISKTLTITKMLLHVQPKNSTLLEYFSFCAFPLVLEYLNRRFHQHKLWTGPALVVEYFNRSFHQHKPSTEQALISIDLNSPWHTAQRKWFLYAYPNDQTK